MDFSASGVGGAQTVQRNGNFAFASPNQAARCPPPSRTTYQSSSSSPSFVPLQSVPSMALFFCGNQWLFSSTAPTGAAGQDLPYLFSVR